MQTPFDAMGEGIGCACYDDPEMCVCPNGEAVLRHYIAERPLPAMTSEQREWCLEEISRGTEYGYRRADYENASDKDKAEAVLNVWTEYCRDKGLI